ncbi:MAG TPA: hypothetical protein VL944_01640 [Candidatus Acidoferrum sp.]|nr:hypothetical protein [Candidatus Acidoferrum sp.]
MWKLSALTAAILFASILSVSAHAAPYPPTFYSFLLKYTQPAAINTSIYTNASVGTNTYVIMQFLDGSYAIVNTTGGAYSFVLNNATAYTLMRPFALRKYYPSNTVLGELDTYMTSYEDTAATNITFCLTETGLNRYTCTESNSCFSCSTVPICKQYLNQYGASSLFGISIANFSVYETLLNSSYNSYFSLLANINVNNSYITLPQLQVAVQRIDNLSTILPRNPLFPIPQGFASYNFSTCTSYVVNEAPWYCNYYGFCPPLEFNSSQIYSVQALLTGILAAPLTNQSIEALAANTTRKAFLLESPSLDAKLSLVITKYYSRFNATNGNASALLQVYYNSSLSSSLKRLQNTFTNLIDYNISENTSSYNASLTAQLQNVSAIYAVQEKSYSTLKAIATNNTALLLKRELEYQNEPTQLAALSYSQESINNVMNAGINSSQYASIYAQLKSVKAGIASVGHPIDFASAVKSVNSGLLASILSGSNAPIASKQAIAPVYILIISLVIVFAIIAAIYFLTYNHLSRGKRLHLHPAAKRAWMLLFIGLIVVGVLCALTVYSYAEAANSFLPIDGFLSQIASHSSVYVAYNGTAVASNLSIENCVSALEATFNQTGKQLHTLTISNNTCVSSTANPYCFDQLLASGYPVIIISGGPISAITYKGLYGQTLYASGESASGSACYLNQVLKVQ